MGVMLFSSILLQKTTRLVRQFIGTRHDTLSDPGDVMGVYLITFGL